VGDETKRASRQLLPHLLWPRSTGAFFALLAFALKAGNGQGYGKILERARFWNTYEEPSAMYAAFKRMLQARGRKDWTDCIGPFATDSARHIIVDASVRERILIGPKEDLPGVETWAFPGGAKVRDTPALSSKQAPSEIGPTAEASQDVLEELLSLARSELALRSPVYVPRPKEEDEIARRLREGDTWVPIEGEAGTGKTTILHQVLRAAVEARPPSKLVPIFIDGPWLLSAPSATPLDALAKRHAVNTSLWELPRILEGPLRAIDRQLVVLLDTLDAVLLTESRHRVERWLQELGELGIPVVSACRPLEARLAKFSIARRAVVLRDFDDGQAREAIAGYVDAYYVSDQPAVRHELRSRLERHYLENAAYADICRRPVTLRMLFDAYGGAYLPERVDRRQLYRDFWDAKVLGGHRHRPVHFAQARQRERLAARIALEMAQGARPRPILPGIAIERILDELQTGWQSYDRLRSDGVLSAPDHAHPPAQVSFFHQSFLEYAAARAILKLPREERSGWLDELLQPLAHKDGSPWLALVEEVAVQAGGTEDAERILTTLASAPTPGAMPSAGCVWCRLPAEISNVHLELGARLAADRSARHACLVRIHDSPEERVEDLLRQFAGAAWESGEQSARFAALECWTRTALLYPNVVGEQLSGLGVVQEAVADPRGLMLSRVAALLSAFLGNADDRAEAELTRFHTALLEKPSAKSRVTLVEAVATRIAVSVRAVPLLQQWLEAEESTSETRTLQELRGAFGSALGPLSPDRSRKEHERGLVECGGETRLRVLSVWRERIHARVWSLEDLPKSIGPISEESLRLFAEMTDIIFGPLVKAGDTRAFDCVLGILQETPRRNAVLSRRVREITIKTLLNAPGLSDSLNRVLDAAQLIDVPPGELEHYELRLLTSALPTQVDGGKGILEQISDPALLLRMLEGLPAGPLAVQIALRLFCEAVPSARDEATRLTVQAERLLDPEAPSPLGAFSTAARAWLLDEIQSVSSERRRLALRVLPRALAGLSAIEVGTTAYELALSWPARTTDSESNATGACILELVKAGELSPKYRAELRQRAVRIARSVPADFEAARRTAFLVLQELCAGDPDGARADASELLGALEAGTLRGTNAIAGIIHLAYPVLSSDPTEAWHLLRRAVMVAKNAGTGRYGWDTLKDSSRRILRVVIGDEQGGSALRDGFDTLPEHLQAAVIECAEDKDDNLVFECVRASDAARTLAPIAGQKFHAWARRRHGRPSK